MTISVIGINHKTAPTTVREKIYFALDKVSLYLQDLLNRGHAQEAVLLSTCNRSELYCETHDIAAVKDWFCAQTLLPRAMLEAALYIYHNEEALCHMMNVACGLDSMILGESQILGQVKEAFSESCTAGGVGIVFHPLFQQIFSIAKEIRTTTAIGACPVSVASAAVHFAKQQLSAFAEANVLLIGAGETTSLLLHYLKPHLKKPITIVNRGTEKAALLAADFGGHAYGLDHLSAAIARADIVFSATGSVVPIVSKEIVAEAIQARETPLLFIDIAVPRDVDPLVAQLDRVKVFCIDALKAIIEQHRKSREHAADKAREMIRKKSLEFMTKMKTLDKVTYTIRAYRGQIEEICQTELMKAKHQLQQGANPVNVLDSFAHAFTQKLLHTPSVQLRQAGVEGRFEFLHFAKQLFAIKDQEIELL